VEEPGELPTSAGDALVSAHPGACLAVFTADCAPVVLASAEGIVGVAHAGWRGLLAGVLQATADAMRALGASSLVAGLGPCIHPGCYEFSPGDLDRVAARVGDGVRGRTSSGQPALDLPAGVRAALASSGVEMAVEVQRCTACSPELFSHRGKGDRGRQAVVAWRA
jgi:YfiH family protein